MNSAAMIDKCFRHQHPEAYGEREVAEPHVPVSLRYGFDRPPEPSRECLTEELVGLPNALRLDA